MASSAFWHSTLSGLELRVESLMHSLALRVCNLGSRFRAASLQFRAYCLGLKVCGLGLRFCVLGMRVCGLGLRVCGLGFGAACQDPPTILMRVQGHLIVGT